MKLTDEMLFAAAPEARDLWLSTLPQREEVPTHRFSRRFEKAMKLLRTQTRRSPRQNRIRAVAKRAAVFALVGCLVAFAGLMTVDAYREKVIETVTHIYREFTEFCFSSSDIPEGTVLPQLEYGYFPAGLEETNHTETGTLRYIVYADGSGHRIVLDQEIVSKDSVSTMKVDTENAQVEHFLIRGSEALAVTKNGETDVIWTEGSVMTSVLGNYPPETIKQIAKEIK